MDDSLLAAHGFVAGPGVGKPLDLGDMRMSLKASAQQTHGALSLFATEDMPGFAPPPHFHTDTAEAFYVLEGEYEIVIGGKTSKMRSRIVRLHPARYSPWFHRGRAEGEEIDDLCARCHGILL